MPATDSLNEDVRQQIALLIGQRLALAPISALNKSRKLGLGESIAVTELRNHLKVNEFITPVFKGRWMNLIKVGNRYIGYSLSSPVGPKETDWMVDCIVKAKLAATLSKALHWTYENVEGDGTIRLLFVPDYHLHALTITLENEVRVVVFDKPSTLNSLRKFVVYRLDDFLYKLRNNSIIRGVEFRLKPKHSK
jgi:hypothetical protein